MLKKYRGEIKTRNNPRAFRELFETEMMRSIKNSGRWHSESIISYIVDGFMGRKKKRKFNISKDELESTWRDNHYLKHFRQIRYHKKG